MIRPNDLVSTLMATPKSSVICINPICKAANQVGHIIDNCFWPGGGKEDSGLSAYSSTSTTHSTATVTLFSTGSHFVLWKMWWAWCSEIMWSDFFFSFLIYFSVTDYSIEGEWESNLIALFLLFLFLFSLLLTTQLGEVLWRQSCSTL